MKYLKIVLFALLTSVVAQAGTVSEAEVIFTEYSAKMKKWEATLASATSMEGMRMAVKQKPDTVEYRDRMIKVVGNELKNAWTLKYSGWLIANTPVGKKDTAFIMEYAEKFHMQNPELGDFCYNVSVSNQPVQVKKAFLEKAMKTIADKKQRGVAAVSLAIILSEMGDNPRNNQRRLELIRQGIIDSNEVKVGSTSVGDTAMEMIYRMKNLSKGRPAPAVLGLDSAGKTVSLSSFKGKVVMLVFWSSYDLPEMQTVKLLDMMRKTEKDYLGKDLIVVGVNRDQIGNLRELEKAGQTSTINISDPQQAIFKNYRIEAPPHCYVIDKQGDIGYSGAMGSFATLTADALLAAKYVSPSVPSPAIK